MKNPEMVTGRLGQYLKLSMLNDICRWLYVPEVATRAKAATSIVEALERDEVPLHEAIAEVLHASDLEEIAKAMDLPKGSTSEGSAKIIALAGMEDPDWIGKGDPRSPERKALTSAICDEFSWHIEGAVEGLGLNCGGSAEDVAEQVVRYLRVERLPFKRFLEIEEIWEIEDLRYPLDDHFNRFPKERGNLIDMVLEERFYDIRELWNRPPDAEDSWVSVARETEHRVYGSPEYLDDDRRPIARHSASRLANILENGEHKDVRGKVFELPPNSMREEQRLFTHQAESIRRLEANGWASGIIHLPTGAGKTRVAIGLMAKKLQANAGERFIWVTEQKGLVRQAMLRVAELAPLFPAGTRMHWLKNGTSSRKDHTLFREAHIVFMTRDSLQKIMGDAVDGRVTNAPLKEALTGRGKGRMSRVTVIYDECHQLGGAKIQSTWRKFDKTFSRTVKKGGFLAYGFSATPLPSGEQARRFLKQTVFPVNGASTAQPNWEMLVHHSVSNRELIDLEILCPINTELNGTGHFDIPTKLLDKAGGRKVKAPKGKINGKALKDFSKAFNANVMSHPSILDFLADRLASNRERLGKTLVFVPTISAANHLAAALRRRMPKGDVSVVHSRLNEFSGEVLEGGGEDATSVQKQTSEFIARKDSPCIMVNVGMLTTGFDDPLIRTVVLARLTFSTNLFWQMIGRGTRGTKCKGTEDCNVIDPIRLADRYEDLDRYRPQFEEEDGRGEKNLIDEPGEGADPTMPVRCNKTVTVGDQLPAISREVRQEVARALKDFLKGGQPDSALLSEVTLKPTVSSDGKRIETTFVPVTEGEIDGVSSLYWMFDQQIKQIEEAIGAKLHWLRSHKYLPVVVGGLEEADFCATLDVVKAKRLVEEADYLGFMTKVKLAGIAETLGSESEITSDRP